MLLFFQNNFYDLEIQDRPYTYRNQGIMSYFSIKIG